MRRLKKPALSLLLGVAIAASDYEVLWAFVVIPAINLVRVASLGLLGLMVRTTLFGFVRVLLTPRQRKKLAMRILATRQYLSERKVRYWQSLPKWVQLPIGMLAGCTLLAFSYIPLKAELLGLAGAFLRDRVFPVLARAAAARGVVYVAPSALESTPHVRTLISRAYIALWIWTISRFVGRRRAFVMYAKLRYKKHVADNAGKRYHSLPVLD